MQKVFSPTEWAAHLGVSADPADVHHLLAEYVRRRTGTGPSIVGIVGGVAAGKSTFSLGLASALSTGAHIVSTDGFLLPNRELETRGIMHRKGFPESYDTEGIIAFLDRIRRREAAEAPVYSHEVYDVTQQTLRIERPDVVIFEGVAAMQIPDSLDTSIYLDAETPILESWFLERVLTLRDEAKADTFYWHFREIPRDEFLELARTVWKEVNLVNLHENILPKRELADLVLHKAADHRITHITDRSG